MQTIDHYREQFLKHLESKLPTKQPYHLYEPINYILQLGGKRLRPVLTLLSANIFDDNYTIALDAALAVEVFHNFTLIHDDIMDDAPLRRGKETVHEKWDLNTGILSGDAMLILAYQLFENYEGKQFKDLITIFSKTALEVCEGQQYDIDFERRNDVTIPEYLKMIEYKTAVLVAAAMKMGAIVSGASTNDQNKIYDFGKNLGIAFQLQDDYLDAFGDPESFGKQVGGDILENKKTYLYLKAFENASPTDKEALYGMFNTSDRSNDKVVKVKELFIKTGADIEIKKAIEMYTQKAFSDLDELQIEKNKKQILHDFGTNLMNRKV